MNEKRKEQALNLYFALLIPPLLSFYWGLAIAGPILPKQIWTNFLRLSLEIFVLFKYLMMCVASSMSTWLRIWPPWKEPKTPENNQIVKVSSTKNRNYSTTTRNYCYIYLHTCRIFRRWTKIQIPLSAHREGKKYLSQVLLAYRPLN